MTKKPKFLNYLPLFLVFVALSFPIQVMFLYGQDMGEFESIFSKLTTMNLFVMGLCLLTSITMYQATKATLMLVPFLLVMVGINNGIVSAMSDDFSPVLTLAATAAFFIVHFKLMAPEIIEVFKHPELRWWLTSPRSLIETPMMLSHMDQELVFRSRTFDLSEKGTFVPFSKSPGVLNSLKVNDELSVCINLGALTQLRCQAKVVRVTAGKGLYPAGLGLRFDHLRGNEKRKLKKYIKRQEMQSQTI